MTTDTRHDSLLSCHSNSVEGNGGMKQVWAEPLLRRKPPFAHSALCLCHCHCQAVTFLATRLASPILAGTIVHLPAPPLSCGITLPQRGETKSQLPPPPPDSDSGTRCHSVGSRCPIPHASHSCLGASCSRTKPPEEDNEECTRRKSTKCKVCPESAFLSEDKKSAASKDLLSSAWSGKRAAQIDFCLLRACGALLC